MDKIALVIGIVGLGWTLNRNEFSNSKKDVGVAILSVVLISAATTSLSREIDPYSKTLVKENAK